MSDLDDLVEIQEELMRLYSRIELRKREVAYGEPADLYARENFDGYSVQIYIVKPDQKKSKE